MSVVDSLEVSIQSRANAAIDSLNKVIKQMGLIAEGISVIGKNSGLQEFSQKAQEAVKEFSVIQDTAKNISSQVGDTGKTLAQSMKPIGDQAKKTAQSLEEISSRYEDLGKGFRFSGTSAQAEKQLDKLNNKLQEALLKEEELGRSGEIGGKKYENAIRDIFKYSNQIENLKEQFKELEIPASGIPHIEIADLSDDEFAKMIEGFRETQKSAEEASKAIENATQEAALKFSSEWTGIELPDLSEKIDLSKMSDQELDKWFNNLPDIKKEAERTARAVSEIKMPEMTYTSFESVGFDPDAMAATYGEAARDIQNYTEAIKRYGNQAGKVMNESLSGSAAGMDALEIKLQQLKIPEIKEDNLSKLQNLLKKTESEIDKLRIKLANGLTMGNITESVGDKGFVRLREQIALTEKQAEALRAKIQDIGSSQNGWMDKFKNGFSGMADSSKKMTKNLSSIQKYLDKVVNKVRGLLSKFTRLGKAIVSIGDSSKKADASVGTSLKTILKYGFGIRSLYALINKMRSAMQEGFGNLVQYSDKVNQSLTSMTSALFVTKNALAVAFSPILNVIAPYVTYLINLLNQALNAIGRFFAALTGGKFAVQAVGVVKDFASGVSKSGGAAKKAANELNRYIAGWHEVNNMTSNDDNDSGGGGGAGGLSPGDMFTTVPIEDSMKNLSDKVRDIFSKLFDPLKQAWEKAGAFVMNSWKYALSEIWELAKSVGRDFLTVWNQPETVAMLTDILYIVGDIGLSIGYLARNFREAWEGGETGLHILENIRDIFATIIHNITLAADATVLWADKLNFAPVLQAIERFTESLIPVVDALSGVLADFYMMVLLPLGKWTIEEGLPRLLDVFTDFNEKVDWESLRSNLQELWTHLEPFAETVGEGLIIFIERISDFVANFINSETFTGFLDKLENWMDSIKPADVANGIELLVKAFIGLKLALLGMSALEGISKFVITLQNMGTAISIMAGAISKIIGPLSLIGGAMLAASNFVKMLSDGFSWLNEALMIVGLALAAVGAVILGAPAAVAAAVAGVAAAVSTIIIVVKDNWESIVKWFSGIIDKAKEIGGNIIQGLADGIDAGIAAIGGWISWVKKTIFDPFINGIKNLFGIHSPSTAMSEIGVFIMEGLLNGIKSLVESVKEIWIAMKEMAIQIWESAGQRLSEIWENIKQIASELWEDIKNMISDTIENIKELIGGIVDFVSGVFTGDWQRAWDGVTGIFDGVKNTVKGIVDGILGFIGDLIGGIQDAISGIDRLENRIDSVSSRTVGNIVDIGLDGSSWRASSFASLPNAEFPGYASGQVIPRSMKKHLAWLGDNNRETEVVSPLSTIKQAVSEAMKDFVAYEPAPLEAHILPDYKMARAYMDMDGDNLPGTWDYTDERAAETDYRSQRILEALEENRDLLGRILAQGIILDDNEFEQRYRRSATKFRRRTGGQLGVQF